MTHERTGMAHSKQPQEIDSVICTSIIASTMVERLRFSNIRNKLLTYRVLYEAVCNTSKKVCFVKMGNSCQHLFLCQSDTVSWR